MKSKEYVKKIISIIDNKNQSENEMQSNVDNVFKDLLQDCYTHSLDLVQSRKIKTNSALISIIKESNDKFLSVIYKLNEIYDTNTFEVMKDNFINIFIIKWRKVMDNAIHGYQLENLLVENGLIERNKIVRNK